MRFLKWYVGVIVWALKGIASVLRCIQLRAAMVFVFGTVAFYAPFMVGGGKPLPISGLWLLLIEPAAITLAAFGIWSVLEDEAKKRDK